MLRSDLFNQIKKKESFLCVGLDPSIDKLPFHLPKTPKGIVTFCKEIISATSDICVTYKPNLAFFECLGPKGWEALEEVMEAIPKDIFTIADAKRGDIGNTSKMYAKTFFEYFNFDAVTVAPYMGIDSVRPFLEFDNKWVILLALTSNQGSKDFQQIADLTGVRLYEQVLIKSQSWGNTDNMMYVVGATHPEALSHIRNIVPDHFLLVPGVGAQGGSVDDVAQYGINDHLGLLINSSRGIIYASDGENFALAARAEALKLIKEMHQYI